MTEDHSALLTLIAGLHDTTESDGIRRIAEDAERGVHQPAGRHVHTTTTEGH